MRIKSYLHISNEQRKQNQSEYDNENCKDNLLPVSTCFQVLAEGTVKRGNMTSATKESSMRHADRHETLYLPFKTNKTNNCTRVRKHI